MSNFWLIFPRGGVSPNLSEYAPQVQSVQKDSKKFSLTSSSFVYFLQEVILWWIMLHLIREYSLHLNESFVRLSTILLPPPPVLPLSLTNCHLSSPPPLAQIWTLTCWTTSPITLPQFKQRLFSTRMFAFLSENNLQQMLQSLIEYQYYCQRIYSCRVCT